MKKIIQLVQSESTESYSLMCLTEDGKVYERDVVSHKVTRNEGCYTACKRFWKEIKEVETDKDFDPDKVKQNQS